jgi:hypothetical protein
MQAAYLSGDFYLTFGKMAGAIPATATKQSHANIRDQFKTVALGVLYGLSAEGLARKLSVPACKGRELLQMHKEAFRTFWKWSDQVEMTAILSGQIRTEFGWTLHMGQDVNPRSIRNFPMQGNGAEMLRLACCLATERGIMVCAPVHDALLVEGSESDIDQVVKRTQAAMEEASAIVLRGFTLRTEAKVVRWPDRYSDPRGEGTWEKVWKILERIEQGQTDADNLGQNGTGLWHGEAEDLGQNGTPHLSQNGTPDGTKRDTRPLYSLLSSSSLS